MWREEKPGAREIWEKYVELRSEHGESENLIESGLQDWFASLSKSHPSKKWSRYKRIDANGPWRDRDISWPGDGGPRYDVIHPKTNKPCKVPESGWRFEESSMKMQIKLGLVEFREDESQPPFRKAHIRPIPAELEADVDFDEQDNEEDNSEEQFATQVRGSYFYKQSQVAVKFLRGLLGAKAFNNPKDHTELARLISYVTGNDPEAIIMDFFAGSASTGHAVFEVNQTDRGNRRFILVQLPQELDISKKEQKVSARFCDELGKPRNISEISKERLRRAGTKIKLDNAVNKGIDKLDIGFRVLKIDTSNMKEVFYTPDLVSQDLLSDQVNNIREDRTHEDLLFQVLLDWGVDLALSITKEVITDKNVYFVDGNALAACFEEGVSEEFFKLLAKRVPLRVVFRDAGFANDSVKINATQIFKLISPTTEIKTI
jgi:adenine-specific DNA-methyltransferase